MDKDFLEVKKNIQSYFEIHLPQYKVLEVRRKSVFEEDNYLYMVSAKKTDGTYVVWTSWNETTQCLNYGHYNLQNLEECEKVFAEFYNNGK